MRLNSFILDSDTLEKLVPAKVIQMLDSYSYLGNLNLDRLMLPYVLLSLLLIVFIVAGKKKWSFRSAVYLVGGVVFIRIILFGNPVAWYFYYKTLDWTDVGFRQVNVIDSELRYYFDPPEEVRYMAMGSSQTGAIYSRYAKENSDFYKLELSGLGPTEYYFYRGIIENVKPDYVLLYLSEFDLARKPSYDTYRYAPKQWLSLLSYSMSLYSADPTESMRTGLKELWISQLFPEFKFSFILKGYLKKIFNTNEVLETGVMGFSREGEAEKTEKQVESLMEIFDEVAIKESINALRIFFEYCKEKNINIVVVEGGYHPQAYDNKNIRLKDQVVANFLELDRQYSNLEYVRIGQLTEFTDRDYVDGYHISEFAGDRLTKAVIRFIEQGSNYEK